MLDLHYKMTGNQRGSEKMLHELITDYKLEFNNLESTPSKLKFDLTYHDNYIKFLNLAMTSMSERKYKVVEMKT